MSRHWTVHRGTHRDLKSWHIGLPQAPAQSGHLGACTSVSQSGDLVAVCPAPRGGDDQQISQHSHVDVVWDLWEMFASSILGDPDAKPRHIRDGMQRLFSFYTRPQSGGAGTLVLDRFDNAI